MPEHKKNILRRIGGRLVKVLPSAIRESALNRLFYAVFQVTRVTNDAYGWKPEPEESSDKKDIKDKGDIQ